MAGWGVVKSYVKDRDKESEEQKKKRTWGLIQAAVEGRSMRSIQQTPLRTMQALGQQAAQNSKSRIVARDEQQSKKTSRAQNTERVDAHGRTFRMGPVEVEKRTAPYARSRAGFYSRGGAELDGGEYAAVLRAEADDTRRTTAAIKAAGYGVAGALKSGQETARAATRNATQRANNPGYQGSLRTEDFWRHQYQKSGNKQDMERWYQSIKERTLAQQRISAAKVDPESTGQRLMQKSQAYRDEAVEGLGGVGRFLTDTGISMVQNAPGIALSAVNAPVGLALLGAQAGGSKMAELNARGVSPEQSLLRGVVSGAIEGATERIPLANLAQIVKGTTGRSVVKDLLRQSGIEATEESISYTMNYLADKAARDPEASWSWEELAENAAAGALSGVVFGTGAMTLHAVSPRSRYALKTAAEAADETAARGPLPLRRGAEVQETPHSVAENAGSAMFRNPGTPDYVGTTALLNVHLDALSAERPVAVVDGTEIPQASRPVERALAFVKSFGGRVTRPGFGEVLFSKSKIKNSLIGHGIGPAKLELFSTIPDVIANGTQIDFAQNWKGRGYDSYVFAAPVEYKGQRVYVAAIVTRDEQAGRYYLHEAVDQSGQVLYGDEKTRAHHPDGFATKGPQDTVSTLGQGEAASPETIIPETPEESKRNISEDGFDMTAYADALLNDATEKWDQQVRQAAERARGAVGTAAKEKPSARETARTTADFLYRKLVDSGDEIRRAGRDANDPYLYAYYNNAKSSMAAAQSMIGLRQSDVEGNRIGPSLTEILAPAKARGKEYWRRFQEYLYHMHNIDRMGTEEDAERSFAAKQALDDFDNVHPDLAEVRKDELLRRASTGDTDAIARVRLLNEKTAAQKRIKPVFDYETTAEISRGVADELLREHPEFAEMAEQVWQYSRNLLQYRVDSGLVSQELADEVQRMYPHYVPTFRLQDDDGAGRSLSKNVRVGKTMKRASGGNAKLMDIDKAMANQTVNVVRESAKNRFGRRLLGEPLTDRYIKEVTKESQRVRESDWEDVWNSVENELKTENTFSVITSGDVHNIVMTPEMFEGVRALETDTGYQNLLPVRISRTANNIYKKLITAWNPIFTVKNLAKDLQDALLYTTDVQGFIRNYPKACREIAENGEMWQRYQALGGTASTVYDAEQGVQLKKTDPLHKVADKIEAVNRAVEQAPRLAEFMATVERGGETQENLMQAIYNAAEITTNFGRSGQWGKSLNANLVPFLNPSIQGFDKFVRTFRDNDHTLRSWIALGARCAALGVVPAIINELLWGDEKDWDLIRNETKDLNFLIPLGDGYWAKLPRGRALSVFAALANGGGRLLRGEEVGAIDILSLAAEQAGPVNPLTSNILTSWVEADLFDQDSPGKTWYGGDIESKRLQGMRPGERYDEKTDMLSRAIGGAVGLSPKKINYLLDAYTGVAGDVLLPLLTPSSPTGDTALSRAASPLTRSFSMDTVSSNNLSQKFYEKQDELEWAANDGDYRAELALRYVRRVGTEISDLNSKLREIESRGGLPGGDRQKQIRDLQREVNEKRQKMLTALPWYQKSIDKYARGNLDEDMEYAYDMANWETFGAQRAIELMGKDEVRSAERAREAGVSYDGYMRFTMEVRDIDKTGDDERSTTLQKMDLLEDLTADGMSTSEAAALYYAKILTKDTREKVDEYVEMGLPLADYYIYKQAVKDANGTPDPDDPGHIIRGSKQEMRLPIINGLDLTPAQKDILWYDNGWSEKTLRKKAPWHW